MQKLFKRSLAMVLAIMMVLTMFAGAVAEETLTPFTSYSEMGSAVYHIANAGINFADDANAMHMQYLAQEFVPATNAISGVKLAMNYGDGQGEMHIEIREGGANGTAVYTENVAVTAKGDGAAWYTFNFSQNVTVTPNTLYAVAFWFQSKTTTSFAIIHGGAKSEQVLWRHKRFESDGSKTYEPAEVTLKTTESTIGFEILAPQAAATDEVVFFDGTSMPHHAADRGKWQPETNNFTTGDFAYRAMADFRSGDKLSHSRLYRDDPVDITKLYNENGEFYLTFDFYADPNYIGKADHYNNDNELLETKNYGLESTRFLILLYSKGENQTAGDPKSGKQAVEVTRWERTNANANETNDWNMFGLENGLQPGWNRMALKMTDKDGVLSYGKSGQEQYWDPTKMWGINFLIRAANWQDKYDQHGTVETVFDNIKFMSVEAYEETVAAIDYNYQFRNCDETGWQNTPRGEFYADSATYTEGGAAIRADLDWRNEAKLMNAWLGCPDNRQTNLDTIDISKAIDKNGDFYITFDLWADPEYATSAKNYDENTGALAGTVADGLNGGRLIVGLVTRGEGQTTTSMDNATISMEMVKPKGTDWTSFGLADGLKPGWNHIAIKANANNLKSGGEAAWDPSKLWGVKLNYRDLNWKDPKDAHGTVQIRFDDLRFMSVAAYEADFARVNAAKAAIAAISEMDKDSDESVAAATAAYNAVPGNAKYLVSNYDELLKVGMIVNFLVDGVEPPYGNGHVLIPAGPQDNTPYATTPAEWKETYTEGSCAGKVQWLNTSNPTMHMAVLGIDKTWDFTDVEYVTMDLYVHGFTVKNTGDTDLNFGYGEAKDAGSWSAQNLGSIGKSVAWEAGIKDLKEGWNHLVFPVPAGARKAAVGNMRLYFEKSVVFNVAEGDKAYAVIDDIRAVNKKGLKAVEELYAAKDVVTAIQAMETVAEIKATRAAYEALNDVQKAYVFNLADLEALEAKALAGDAVDQAYAALTDKTFAGKEAIDAVYAQYAVLDDAAKAYATCGAELEALKAEMDAKQATLDDANAKIAAIPALEELQLFDRYAIDAAKTAYEALAEDVKPFAVGADKIEPADKKVAEMFAAATDEQMGEFVSKVIVETLPSADAVTLADAELVANVAATYDEYKAFVSAEATAKMYALRAVVAALQADKDAADAVNATVNALPETLTLENKDDVYGARDAYAAMNDNAKAQVTVVDALNAAVAAMDKLVADDAAAKAITEAANALAENATKEEMKAVVDLYDAASADAKALLAADVAAKCVAVKAEYVNMDAYEICFRTFDNQKADYNCNLGGVFHKKDIPAVGTGYMGGVVGGNGANEIHHYIYAYDQNHQDQADGTNKDGMVKFLVDDAKDLYVSFDFYVSDAAPINAVGGDCGFGIDASNGNEKDDIGTFQAWGSTFIARRDVVTPVLKAVKTGWNHIVLPLSLQSKSAAAKMEGKEITFMTMRFYAVGLQLPAGFVTAVDDVRIMNGKAAEAIFPARTNAKVVTDMIRAYPAEATENDYYAVRLAYEAVADEYKDLVIGWDAFATANAVFESNTDVQFAEDKAAVAPVVEAIAALDKEITVADEEAIVAAEKALADLSDNQKVLVGNANILTAARAALDAALAEKADKDAAQAVIDAINALPETVSDTDVSNTDIAAARAAYDALTDAQKALIAEEIVAKLAAAEANLVIAIDMAAAAEVEAMINALATPTDITVSDTDVVNAAAEAYGKLTAAQKEYLGEGVAEKLAACVAALEEALTVKLGDVDGNGTIDAKDALMVLKAAVGKLELTDKQAKAADTNKDGKIDAKDALEILKTAVGK